MAQPLCAATSASDSLADSDKAAILAFLQEASAANRQPLEASADGMPPRITATRWFRHEHHEVSQAKFARPSVGGPGNCVACHRDAEQGRFGRVKIPKA